MGRFLSLYNVLSTCIQEKKKLTKIGNKLSKRKWSRNLYKRPKWRQRGKDF